MNKPYKIYAEQLEEGVLDQFFNFMNHPSVVKGALMPDAHLGYSLPIGGVIASLDTIFPAAVGFDIGCGMCAVPILGAGREELNEHAEEIRHEIRRSIPMGFNHRKKPHPNGMPVRFLNSLTPAGKEIFHKVSGFKQLGTLGGGNHFIEIGDSDSDEIWVIVHSGSRGFGHAIATHYMKLASGTNKAKEGTYGLDANSIEGKNYITDMNACLDFALENRRLMVDLIVSSIGSSTGKDVKMVRQRFINRNHNHAEMKDGLWIHRKGATHAEKGMMGVIPGNMKHGSFIVQGLGNPDSLFSSSHGAGRILSRKKAKEVISMADFTKIMRGVHADVTKETLDESPFAYKNIFDVMRHQRDLVTVLAYIMPIINIKDCSKKRR